MGLSVDVLSMRMRLRRLDACLRRGVHQRTRDVFPRARLDRTDHALQRRLLRPFIERQTRDRFKAGRVTQVERQLLIAQLPLLLEQRTDSADKPRRPVAFTSTRRRSSNTLVSTARSASSHSTSCAALAAAHGRQIARIY